MAGENFIDSIKVFARSGNGGAGSVHFARTKFNSKAGPDGGDGGRGGHIILEGNENLWTLLHLRYHKNILAQNGTKGGANKVSGASGQDIVIQVPLGTIARDAETGMEEAEILYHGQRIIWLAGGKGGRGNSFFKSATNQSPQYAQPGLAGQEGYKILELKLLADVGLVGLPNAGKSTLLATISAARPEIAPYPFTTLQPQLGIVAYKAGLSFCVADLPGIIEKASEGKGLGLRFLRHIERNSLLLFVVAVDSENWGENNMQNIQANISQTFKLLRHELQIYNPELMHKPKLLAISKADLLSTEQRATLTTQLNFPELIAPPIFISSHSNFQIDKLKDQIWQSLQQLS